MPSRPAGAAAPRRNIAIETPSTEPSTEVDVPARPAQAAHAAEMPTSGVPSPVPASRKPRRPRIIVKSALPPTPPHVTAVDYPVQVSKVQAPPLRDDTLARDRLLDWLSVKVHSRVVLLTAEAGYGKTTLLADFSRRTRIRVLWYRLDRGDRDWVGLIAHLVAAVRVHQGTFGEGTSRLLREMATGPTIETVLDTFLRELGGLANEPAAFVFDDVHLVDDSSDVKQILRELVARGPERMSFVFASRREPPIRLARLRALGEVAELLTDDLRFDAAETERLFRETYEIPLEPSVLGELSRRTEGWAASLQLVRAAIHDRNPAEVRSFISSLSGAEGRLYEYLAEEVIGDLPDDLQQFLMRTSVLESVDLDLGPVAAAVAPEEARILIDAAEHHGLLGRRGPSKRSGLRAHHLVRDFLQARLRSAIGPAGIRAIHLAVATAARPSHWQISSRHFAAGGFVDDAAAVIREAVDVILATGAYSAAHEVLSGLGGAKLTGVQGMIIEARLALGRASIDEALTLAEAAWRSDVNSSAALMTLTAARMAAGDVSGAIEGGRILQQSSDEEFAPLGRAVSAVLETSTTAPLALAVDAYESLVPSFRSRGADHYLGVALLNLSLLRIATDEPRAALSNAEEAIALLSKTSAGVELASARIARAEALEVLGNLSEARHELERAVSDAGSGQILEILLDAVRIEALLGESSYARPLVARFAPVLAPNTDYGEQALYARALLRIQDGDLLGARADVELFRHGEPRSTVAFEARRLLAEGLVATLDGRDGRKSIEAGTRLADSQGAKLASRYGHAMGALADRTVDPSGVVTTTARDCSACLSMLAEVVISRLGDLDSEAMAAVSAEAKRRPWRWLASVRRVLIGGPATSVEHAASLLVAIGAKEDIPLLHSIARRRRELKGRKYGHQLSRRLADRVLVEDIGKVSVLVGDRLVDGSEIRRKVLALLCLLLTRPNFASTRDEVLDNLWPDHDPTSALNSLNQTVYFLRRVFEPEFSEETSAGYVGQDGETIWLDRELVDSRSQRCFELIRSMPDEPTPDGSIALATSYGGRFALDFMYEEWAAAFRDQLHSAYLRVMEHAIRLDLDTGHLRRGTFLAERATAVDSEAEGIQLALVRLYRLSSAHAAASEQYARYARSMRDLGVEPAAFADL